MSRDPDAWRATYDNWKTTEPDRYEDEPDEPEPPNECQACGRDIPPREDFCFDCHRRGYG